MKTIFKSIPVIAIALLGLTLGSGCSHTAPTIAHTHVGHAITGFKGTPGDKGLFVVAEERGAEILALAREIERADTTVEKPVVQELIDVATSSDYGFRMALQESASHVVFAAESDDASANLRNSGKAFADGVEQVINRTDLMVRFASDMLDNNNPRQVALLRERVVTLADQSVNGGDGADAVGLAQLRRELDAMVDRENPPYVTVDRWYLFNLVRLPNCNNCWAWPKWGRGGGGEYPGN